mmetsp:Transcript_22427/g.53802  ORF Transcript_22427/g.53802 Transcript_22427/m.53802 type:complete len:203 (+) Transcript_22427:708-1316(+)
MTPPTMLLLRLSLRHTWRFTTSLACERKRVSHPNNSMHLPCSYTNTSVNSITNGAIPSPHRPKACSPAEERLRVGCGLCEAWASSSPPPAAEGFREGMVVGRRGPEPSDPDIRTSVMTRSPPEGCPRGEAGTRAGGPLPSGSCWGTGRKLGDQGSHEDHDLLGTPGVSPPDSVPSSDTSGSPPPPLPAAASSAASPTCDACR